MVSKKALVLGASSATGGHLLKLLLQDEAYSQIIVYARKNLKATKHKLVEKIIDYENLDTPVEVDEVFCCLGARIKKAGGKQAFKQISLDFALKVAKLQKVAGSTSFLAISTINANAASGSFYNQVKGKLEEGLKEIGFKNLFIFQPSLIIDNKEQSFKEKCIAKLFKTINPILIGPLKKYRLVKAREIAKAMVYFANSNYSGTKYISSIEIKEFES